MTKEIKRRYSIILAAIMILGMMIASMSNARAACLICFGSDCYWVEGTCEGFTSSSATCTEWLALAFHLDNGHLLSAGGQAWLVKGDRKTAVASDSHAVFISKMKVRYATEKKRDPQAQRQIQAEYDAFLKKPDNSKISARRLDILSKETGLRIVKAKVGGAIR